MELKDCIPGKCYVWEDGSFYLNLFKKDLSDYNIDCFIDIRSLSFHKLNSRNRNPKNIREATPEEEHWLWSCKNISEFVDYKTAMLSFVKPNIITKDDPELSNILIKLLTQ